MKRVDKIMQNLYYFKLQMIGFGSFCSVVCEQADELTEGRTERRLHVCRTTIMRIYITTNDLKN